MRMSRTAAITRRLVEHHGWRADSLLGHVVTKDYPTAVGLKQAIVRVTTDAGHARHWLTATYWSEGRNAVGNCAGCLPDQASIVDLERQVDGFARGLNQAVADTYAARLLAA